MFSSSRWSAESWIWFTMKPFQGVRQCVWCVSAWMFMHVVYPYVFQCGGPGLLGCNACWHMSCKYSGQNRDQWYFWLTCSIQYTVHKHKHTPHVAKMKYRYFTSWSVYDSSLVLPHFNTWASAVMLVCLRAANWSFPSTSITCSPQDACINE